MTEINFRLRTPDAGLQTKELSPSASLTSSSKRDSSISTPDTQHLTPDFKPKSCHPLPLSKAPQSATAQFPTPNTRHRTTGLQTKELSPSASLTSSSKHDSSISDSEHPTPDTGLQTKELSPSPSQALQSATAQFPTSDTRHRAPLHTGTVSVSLPMKTDDCPD